MSPRPVRHALALFVATGFGSGRSPLAPGTAGTLAAMPLAILASRALPPSGFAAAAAALVAIGVWTAGVAAPILGAKDPGAVVVDEFAGLFVTLLYLPADWPVVVGAFFLFRLADVVKPFPARQAEKLPGGWGIVLDDVVAGLYANVALRAAIALAGMGRA